MSEDIEKIRAKKMAEIQEKMKNVEMVMKLINTGNWEDMADITPGRHLQLRNTRNGKTTTIHVKQDMSEAQNDYFKRRKDEEDRIAGTKAPAKRTPKQTDYDKKRKQQDVAEGEVVPLGKKHSGDLGDIHSCPKCGGDLQGGNYQGHRVKVCQPCKQVYLPPNSGIDQQGNKTNEQGVAEGSEQQLSVQQLAAISDEALDKAYGYGRSSPGNTFGWQANLKSAAYAKQLIDKGVNDIEAISNAIHTGWNVTAQAFVQNPDQFADTEKLKAAGKLEGKLQQRAQLMKQNYAQLPEDEKEKDRVVARAMLQAITGGQQGVAEASYINGKEESPTSLRWKQTSMSQAEAIAKYGKEHVRLNGKDRRGVDVVEIHTPLGGVNEGGDPSRIQQLIHARLGNATPVQVGTEFGKKVITVNYNPATSVAAIQQLGNDLSRIGATMHIDGDTKSLKVMFENNQDIAKVNADLDAIKRFLAK